MDLVCQSLLILLSMVPRYIQCDGNKMSILWKVIFVEIINCGVNFCFEMSRNCQSLIIIFRRLEYGHHLLYQTGSTHFLSMLT
jgi:hypothetical protein